MRRLAKLELDLNAERVRREAAEKEMQELQKNIESTPRPAIPAKLSS